MIAGKTYPPRPISFNDILPQLRKATGSIGDKFNTFSIDNQAMTYALSATTTVSCPAKLYRAVSLEIVPWSSVLLSGVSSAASHISCRFNITTATAKSATCSLLLFCDAIIEIDPATKNASVKQ